MQNRDSTRKTARQLLSMFSCFLLSLLPASATTPSSSSSSLLPVAVALAAFACERVAGAEGECCGCETVGEVDLRADGVGEVGDYEDVLNVVVAGEVSLGVQSEGIRTYKSRSMSEGSTFGARLRAFIRNWPSADDGSASSSRTLLT